MIDGKYYNSTNMATQKISSRRAKTESKKMFRQTLLMLFFSIVLIIVFIFIILPLFLKLISKQSSSDNTNQETLVIQTPIISTPVNATNSAQLTISGFGQKDTTIYLLLNGSENQKKTVEDEAGKFEIPVELTAGENRIKLYAENQDKKQSNLSSEYLVIYDNDPPKIELESPTEGQKIELRKNQLLTVKGTSEPDAKIDLNGRIIRVGKEGLFSATYQLSEGENKLIFIATDLAGNATTLERIVSFKL